MRNLTLAIGFFLGMFHLYCYANTQDREIKVVFDKVNDEDDDSHKPTIDPFSINLKCIEGTILNNEYITLNFRGFNDSRFKLYIITDHQLVTQQLLSVDNYTSTHYIDLSSFVSGHYTIILISDTGECYEGSFVL